MGILKAVICQNGGVSWGGSNSLFHPSSSPFPSFHKTPPYYGSLLPLVQYDKCGSLAPAAQEEYFCCPFFTNSQTHSPSPTSMRKLDTFCETRIISNSLRASLTLPPQGAILWIKSMNQILWFYYVLSYWNPLSETRQAPLGAWAP